MFYLIKSENEFLMQVCNDYDVHFRKRGFNIFKILQFDFFSQRLQGFRYFFTFL